MKLLHSICSLLLAALGAQSAAAADCRFPTSQVENWPEIERRKAWRSVLVCDGATVDTAVPRDQAWDQYQQICAWLSDNDISVNDLQLVIRDRAAIAQLDSLTRKDMGAFYYTPNWDLMRDHRPTDSRDDADELIIRGNSPTRIWNADGLGDFHFGTPVPTYQYASNTSFFIDPTDPNDATAPRTDSRVGVAREGDALRVSLFRFYPFREVASYVLRNCRHP